MNCRAVFCDVDGTLVTSDRRVLPRTCAAIKQLQAKGVPFVIVTARSPSGVYPIQRAYGFQCDIIAYSGGLILDEKGNVLLHRGFPRNKACEIIAFAEENGLEIVGDALECCLAKVGEIECLQTDVIPSKIYYECYIPVRRKA